jgi:hypothetical protein
MAKMILYAENSKEEIMEVDRYDSMVGVRIPVGLFAPDVTLIFEEDLDELEERHWRRKNGLPETDGDSDDQHKHLAEPKS